MINELLTRQTYTPLVSKQKKKIPQHLKSVPVNRKNAKIRFVRQYRARRDVSFKSSGTVEPRQRISNIHLPVCKSPVRVFWLRVDG